MGVRSEAVIVFQKHLTSLMIQMEYEIYKYILMIAITGVPRLGEG